MRHVDSSGEGIGPDWEMEVDNVAIVRKPISSGFLVSFLVDARGGMLQSRRLPEMRFFIPPNAATGPTRIICRLTRSDRVNLLPSINDGEGLASR
ncbi:unnamed protein product [Protopolystoma xenopodis]|uniref:ZU5 domain-containing protein n=1 Tax=Protopolystoma xenopodis TaxID=117903 RepID=A0A448XC02_9PLAT|nr:unnamed protein product [Protopolystoma xenopodis]